MLNKQAMKRWTFEGADARISAQVFNDAAEHTLIVLHGMRDHGSSLHCLAATLPHFKIVFADLRGHGQSDHSGAYSMSHFVADLLALYDFFDLTSAHVLGHSLGGHIATRFAALFPERVTSLVIVDGFGPPNTQTGLGIDTWIAAQRAQIEQLGAAPRRAGRLQDKAAAAERYLRNQPRLSEEAARYLSEMGVQAAPEGGLTWRWDPRVQMVWSTFSKAESEAMLECIVCDVLIITGSEGLAYWLTMHPELEGQDDWYQSELQRRINLIPRAKSLVIENAGHMVHFDQPVALSTAVADFLSPLLD